MGTAARAVWCLFLAVPDLSNGDGIPGTHWVDAQRMWREAVEFRAATRKPSRRQRPKTNKGTAEESRTRGRNARARAPGDAIVCEKIRVVCRVPGAPDDLH